MEEKEFDIKKLLNNYKSLRRTSSGHLSRGGLNNALSLGSEEATTYRHAGKIVNVYDILSSLKSTLVWQGLNRKFCQSQVISTLQVYNI